MSKSVLIKTTEKFNKDELIEKLGVYFVHDNSTLRINDLLLSFNEKSAWILFKDHERGNDEYEVQFSNDFNKEEGLLFIQNLQKILPFDVIDVDLG